MLYYQLFSSSRNTFDYVTNNYAGYISNFMRHIDLRSEESMRYFTVRDKILDDNESLESALLMPAALLKWPTIPSVPLYNRTVGMLKNIY